MIDVKEKYAYLPKRLTNGKRVWLRWYIEEWIITDSLFGYFEHLSRRFTL